MRSHATIYRLVPILMLSLSIGSITGWKVPSVLAEDNRPQPTLRDLIGGKAKDEQATKPVDPDSLQLGVPEDPLGRDVPRSSVRGFLAAVDNRDYARAAEYLDLRNLPTDVTPEQGQKLARQLKIVLDRVLWIDLELLSTSLEGDRTDNLPVVRDRIGRITTDAGKVYDVLLQRIPRGDGAYIWKFSGATVADIPDLYKEYGYGPFERAFPAFLFDVSLMGIHLWMWLLAIVMGIALYPVAILITRSAIYVLSYFNSDLAQSISRFFAGPMQLLLWTVLGRSAIQAVGPSVAVRAVGQARTFQVFALAWLLLRVVDFAAHRASSNLDRKGLAGALVLLKPLAQLLKAVAVTAAVLLWLDNIGFKVTTLLAGLSISGVAVALASQKSLENIFAAFTLFAAQPVKVGDFCRFGDKMGIVEEIGLRATRIRTLERSVITIANAEFAGMHLDNLSKRDRFWYHPRLALRYETTPDQIRYILVEVRKMLYAHPKVLSDPMHVRFSGFGESALNIELFAYIGVPDYTESLEVAEDLNLRIMEIIAAAGSDFALPVEIQYELPGKPFDDQRAQAIAAQVKEWETNRALYLPNFPKEKIAEIKGSLDYPPKGSPHYANTPT